MADPTVLDVAESTPTMALDVTEQGAAPLPAVVTPTPHADPMAGPPEDVVATAVASLDAKLAYARVMIQSSLVPKSLTHGSGRNPEPLPIEQAIANFVVVMEYGNLLNLHPMVALSEINVLDGKPGCSGKLMRAKVREAGHKLRIYENSRQRAEIAIRLADDPESEKTRFSFDLTDAVRAGLCEMGSDGEARSRAKWDANKVLVWEAYTDAMLFERAMAKAIRALCPEVMMGVSYTVEELESMTRGMEPPPELKEPEWPHDYGNGVNLRDTATAKNALLSLCDGSKPKAAELWEEHFDHLPVQGLVLGHLRAVLDLPAPDGDTSVTPPLPLAEEAEGSEVAVDMATGNQTGSTDSPSAIEQAPATTPDGPPDADQLAAWLKVYERLGEPALLGAGGWDEFQEWGRAKKKRSNARTQAELDEVVGKAREIYSEVHGGPHQWDPEELALIDAEVADLAAAEDQGPFKAFEAFAFANLARPLPETWTSGQREVFLPWLAFGGVEETGADNERTAA